MKVRKLKAREEGSERVVREDKMHGFEFDRELC
jgi:hypothetical protein